MSSLRMSTQDISGTPMNPSKKGALRGGSPGKGRRVLVTGVAGFIGFHLTRKLLSEGFDVLGVDNMNSYYSQDLKRARLNQISPDSSLGLGEGRSRWDFHQMDLADPSLASLVRDFQPTEVVHLAAQAGVRYSIENPEAYVHSNVLGFVRLLEVVKDLGVGHFVYASSSSVYGSRQEVPFRVEDRVDTPLSFYAVTKRTNELTAQIYSKMYGIPMTGLRFFTVYGSWGRPDMAYFSFSEKIFKGEKIQLFNGGQMQRDFTHVSDIVESIGRLIPLPPSSKTKVLGESDQEVDFPHRLLNIGAESPVPLLEFVEILEELIGKKAQKEFLPMQPGDMVSTFADVEALEVLVQYKPKIHLREGLGEFVNWYRSYFKISQ